MQQTNTTLLPDHPRGSNWRNYILVGSVDPVYTSTILFFARVKVFAPDAGRLYAMGWQQSLAQDSNPTGALNIQVSPPLPDGQYEIGSVVEVINRNVTTESQERLHYTLVPASSDVPMFVWLQDRAYRLFGIDPANMPINRMGIWVLSSSSRGSMYSGSSGGVLASIYDPTVNTPALTGPVYSDPSNPNYTAGAGSKIPWWLIIAALYLWKK